MKKRLYYLLIALPFLIGLVIGSFFDFEINQALYIENNNVFGLTFSGIMPLISYAYMAFAGGYIFHSAINEKKTLHKLFFIAVGVCCFGVSIYYTMNKFYSINAFGEAFPVILALIISLVIEGGITAFGFLVEKKNDNKQFVYASTILLIFITIELLPVAQILKVLMRRPRYRTLVSSSPFYLVESRFVEWWVPFRSEYKTIMEWNPSIADAISEDFKSFPSGHTAEAGMLIFGLPLMTMVFPKLKGKEIISIAIGVAFTILMGLSRMTMGAHYLSDVCMGALTMIICAIIANELILKFVLKKGSN